MNRFVINLAIAACLFYSSELDGADAENQDLIASVLSKLKAKNVKAKLEGIDSVPGLGKLAREVAPQLLVLLNDEDKVIQARAAEVLVALGNDNRRKAFVVLNSLRKEYGEAGDLATQIVKDRIGILTMDELYIIVHDVNDGDSGTRDGTIWFLKKLGPRNPEVVKILISLLDEPRTLGAHAPDPDDLRLTAVSALRDLGPLAKEAIPVIAEALESDDYSVCLSAADALRAMAKEKEAKGAIPALTKAMRGRRISLPLDAAAALLCIEPSNGEAFQVLVDGLQKRNVETRIRAATGFLSINPLPKKAIPVLEKSLMTPWTRCEC
ncbi:MAG: HEAT repeat domain-containing protein [Gemmataceae bacterium]